MSTFERLCNEFGSYPDYTSRLESKLKFEVRLVDGKIFLHTTNYDEAIEELDRELATSLQEMLRILIDAAVSDTSKDNHEIKKILKSTAKGINPAAQLIQISIDQKNPTSLERMVSDYLLGENRVSIGIFMLKSFGEKAAQIGMELEEIATDTECLALTQFLKNVDAVDQVFIDRIAEFLKLETGNVLPDISEIFTTIKNITNEEYIVLASIIGVYIHDQIEDS